MRALILVSVVAVFTCCAPTPDAPEGEVEEVEEVAEAERETGVVSPLKDALSFHASFDGGPNADFARGDGTLYTAPSYDALDEAQPGIGSNDIELVSETGRFGGALQFKTKNEHAVFYRATDNVAYAPSGWSGTVSFWLSLDPAVDLEPGFCDPIQITDSRYNDAAVWVDFTAENPRQFRLGIFGDLHAWNPEELSASEYPFFGERLIVVEPPPFSKNRWTHVVITYSGLGSEGGGTANLYLDGEAAPETMEGIQEPFTWDDPGTIRLGVNYVGLYDELALFERPLSPGEVKALNALDSGVAELYR